MLIVYFVCKIKKKAPLKGLIFDIKGIQIGKMLEKQMQFILSPLHKAINYDKSFAWFKNRLKGPKHHALKAQAPGAFCPFYYICTWKNKEVKIFISANFC